MIHFKEVSDKGSDDPTLYWLINWCLTPTLAVFQLYLGVPTVCDIGAALAPKMLAPEKSPGIKFCCQFQKVGARKFRCHNLFVQNRSLSSMQILSLMTPALKSWYCCSITGYMSKG
jgi:hypothetical protein